jgi:hypothetical protein
MQFAAHECPPGSPIRLDYQLLGARIVLEETPQPAACERSLVALAGSCRRYLLLISSSFIVPKEFNQMEF